MGAAATAADQARLAAVGVQAAAVHPVHRAAAVVVRPVRGAVAVHGAVAVVVGAGLVEPAQQL